MRKNAEEIAYRCYVTDALMILTKNTAKFAGGDFLKGRYYDQIKPKEKEPQDGQSGRDIAKNLIGALAGKGGNQ